MGQVLVGFRFIGGLRLFALPDTVLDNEFWGAEQVFQTTL
jgi:hypothetical protein